VNTINHKLEAAVDITKLSPHPQNPRRGSVEAIGESVEANGFYGVVIAQLSTGRILVGNHRYQVALAQGAKKLPVAWVDVDDRKALEILLSDNRASDLATQDDDALGELLKELAATGDLTGTGYTEDDLNALIADAGSSAGGEPDPYETWSTIRCRVPDSIADLWEGARERVAGYGPLHEDEQISNGQVLEVAVADFLSGPDRAR